jgi:hypothetical protein
MNETPTIYLTIKSAKIIQYHRFIYIKFLELLSVQVIEIKIVFQKIQKKLKLLAIVFKLHRKIGNMRRVWHDVGTFEK